MSLVGEIHSIIKGIYLIFIRRKKNGGWERLDINQVPMWVERASHRFYNKHPLRNYDRRKDFTGKTYLYRIVYKKSSHGRIIEEYYRKKKILNYPCLNYYNLF